MKLPSCPKCNANLFWTGLRMDRREFDTEQRSFFSYAGYRTYCKKCGVRLRASNRWWSFVVAAALVIANGFGAHRAVFEAWGYPGVVAMYVAWTVALLFAILRTRYRVFDPDNERLA